MERERSDMRVTYVTNVDGRTWWCQVHKRPATHRRLRDWELDGQKYSDDRVECDPSLGGICIPCRVEESPTPTHVTHTTKDAYTITLHQADGRMVRLSRQDALDLVRLLLEGVPTLP